MLRSISMHNFIHFNEPQRLEFQDGANFLIGGNSTGKTAIFELVRRCFSNKLNTTSSSFSKDGPLPYIVSHFKIPDSVKCLPTKTSDILACLFIEKCSDEGAQQTFYKYYKVLCVLQSNKKIDVYVNPYTGSYACNTDELRTSVPKHVKYEDNELTIIQDIIENKENLHQNSIHQLFDLIKRLENSLLQTDEDASKNMQLYFDWLDQSYVGVMPMRSIGPLQWTKSAKNLNRESNYRMACDRAEILNALLDSDQIDTITEHQFRKALVYPYRFIKETLGNITTIWVYNEEDKEAKKNPLLKTPEGIVEAQQLILILSNRNLLTITLEEPERGMHPHMIMKMRDWVLKKVKNKTVLIVSHQSAILDHEAIQRSYLCHTTQKCGTTFHTVVKFPKKYNRYGRSDEIRQLLFSPRILFVEGLVDKIILEAILNLLINNNDADKLADDENFRNYIASLHVINMGGKDEGPKVKELCKDIKRRCFVLYDLDVLFAKGQNKESSPIRLCGENVKEFAFDETFININAFQNNPDISARFTTACENAEVFVWKCGSIEDVINEIVGWLDDDVKKRLALPISTNKNDLKRWKRELVDRNYEDIEKLARTLLNHSKEVQRFCTFLKQMMKIENNINISHKRKGTDDYDPLSSPKVSRSSQ